MRCHLSSFRDLEQIAKAVFKMGGCHQQGAVLTTIPAKANVSTCPRSCSSVNEESLSCIVAKMSLSTKSKSSSASVLFCKRALFARMIGKISSFSIAALACARVLMVGRGSLCRILNALTGFS